VAREQASSRSKSCSRRGSTEDQKRGNAKRKAAAVQTPKQLRSKWRDTLLQVHQHLNKPRPKKPNIAIHDPFE
jgi:hypothetical protein